ARGELQRAGTAHDAARGIERTSIHDSGAAGLDSLSNFLLPGELGILFVAAAARGIARRRIRGMHRLEAREWLLDVRRVVVAGGIQRRSADLLPCVPSVALQ